MRTYKETESAYNVRQDYISYRIEKSTEIYQDTVLLAENGRWNSCEWSYIANGLAYDKLEKAEYILIDFWHTGCKPCIEEIPELNELHDKLKKRDDIVFISINADHFETKRNKEFTNGSIKKFNIRFPVVFDDDATNISKELDVIGYPTKMIVNREGQILEKANGSDITLSTFMELLSSKN